jgi:nitroreductase
MEKPAPTQDPIHDLIRRRWSPRAFSDRPVEAEELRSLFEAARWAPSSYGDEPWRFIVATKENPEEFDRMLQCLVELNIRWARSAAVLIISVAHLKFSQTGGPNRHALHDVGLATENLMLQAFDLGLYVHPMGGFHVGKTREVFNIPADYEPVAAIAVGYPGEPESLPEDLRKIELGPRTRKPLQELVFTGTWGESARIVGDHD